MLRDVNLEKRIFEVIAIEYMAGKLADPRLIYKFESKGSFATFEDFMSYIFELGALGYVKLTHHMRLWPGNKWEDWEEELAR